MIKLKSLLLEEPQTAPTPTKPVTKPDTDTPTKPTPRRRSTPSPSTSPTPAPKAKTLMGEESEVMKQIVDRYMSAFNKLSEADYDNIFDPETLGKLKGSVTQRMQGKNPMQIVGNSMQLAQQVIQLEQGSQDLLEQLAYDIIYEAYPYLKSNEDVIEIDAKIVPQAQVKEALQPNSPQEEDIDELSVEEEKEIKIGEITNEIKLGPFAGKRNMAVGVKNILEEYLQEKGLDLSPSATQRLKVNIVYLDVLTTKTNISVFHKGEEEVVVRLQGILYKEGKKEKEVVVEESSSEISMSTLIVDEGGKFNQTSLSNALKKASDKLITKLLVKK